MSIGPEAGRRHGRVTGWVGALRQRRPWAAERSDGPQQSEARAGLESSNADADPPVIWGRLHAWGSNRHAHPRDPPGEWVRHVGRVIRSYRGRPVADEGSGLRIASGGGHGGGGKGPQGGRGRGRMRGG